MKKLLVLLMTLTVALNLVACGGEEITLESRTIYNLTMDIPSDIGEFSETSSQIQMASNKDNTAVITISDRADAEGITADLFDEEIYSANMLAGENFQLLEFSNSEKVAGATAVYAHYSGENSGGVEAEGYNYMLFFDDGTYQSIAFTFTEGADSFLKENLTTVVNSIK